MGIIFTEEEFVKAKVTAEATYEKIGSVRCPFLETTVAFNAKGLDHLKLKRWNHAREQKRPVGTIKTPAPSPRGY